MSDGPGAEDQATAQQYLLDLHFAQGVAYREIARQLGRSPRMLAFVVAGQKPGRNLIPALRELAATGRVTGEPERRLTASGIRARVRSRRGQPSVVPAPPRRSRTRRPGPATPVTPATTPPTTPGPVGRSTARSAQQPDFTVREPEARNTFRMLSDVNETTLRGNHSLQAPKRRWSYGRWEANDAFAKIAGDAAAKGLRLHAAVHVEIGTGPNKRRIPVKIGGKGGYAASNVHLGIQVEGGDAFGWLSSQVAGRYPEFDAEEWTVIAVDVDVW